MPISPLPLPASLYLLNVWLLLLFDSCLPSMKLKCCELYFTDDLSIFFTFFRARAEPIYIEVVGPLKSWITMRKNRLRNSTWSLRRWICYSALMPMWLYDDWRRNFLSFIKLIICSCSLLHWIYEASPPDLDLERIWFTSFCVSSCSKCFMALNDRHRGKIF